MNVKERPVDSIVESMLKKAKSEEEAKRSTRDVVESNESRGENSPTQYTSS